jgi:hypothetical protein
VECAEGEAIRLPQCLSPATVGHARGCFARVMRYAMRHNAILPTRAIGLTSPQVALPATVRSLSITR